MENYSYRSKSYREAESGGNRSYGGPTGMQELRSYSTSQANYPYYDFHSPDQKGSREHRVVEIKREKKGHNLGKFSASSRNWSIITDPEVQRKKRVAGYKVYAVEGKLKGSFRKSFRWIKQTYDQVVHGYS